MTTESKSSQRGGWIILRTAPRHTLRLAKTLVEDGFECWAPVEMRRVRRARSHIFDELKAPIMPGFVFARVCHLDEMLELEHMAVKPRRGAGLQQPAHDPFSVFRSNERIPVIHDDELEPLRIAEVKVVPARRRNAFQRGESVRVRSGICGGMEGIVERGDGKFTLVCFRARLSVKISTFILKRIDANRPQLIGTAAPAA